MHLSFLLPSSSSAVLHFVAILVTDLAGALLDELELLPQDGEVGLVCGQAQHDQVSCMREVTGM